MGQDQDDLVCVPYTTAQKRLMGITYIENIIVSAVSPQAIDRATDEITSLLRQRHRIGRDQDDDFEVRSQQDIADAATQMSGVLTVLLGAIASVSLLVGGIGIMNIMLVSVTERTREIGVRRAMGARRSDIRTQFLIESSLISGLGGAVGIALGIFVARAHRAVRRLADPGPAADRAGSVHVRRRDRRLLRPLPRRQGGPARPHRGAEVRIRAQSPCSPSLRERAGARGSKPGPGPSPLGHSAEAAELCDRIVCA